MKIVSALLPFVTTGCMPAVQNPSRRWPAVACSGGRTAVGWVGWHKVHLCRALAPSSLTSAVGDLKKTDCRYEGVSQAHSCSLYIGIVQSSLQRLQLQQQAYCRRKKTSLSCLPWSLSWSRTELSLQSKSGSNYTQWTTIRWYRMFLRFLLNHSRKMHWIICE